MTHPSMQLVGYNRKARKLVAEDVVEVEDEAEEEVEVGDESIVSLATWLSMYCLRIAY